MKVGTVGARLPLCILLFCSSCGANQPVAVAAQTPPVQAGATVADVPLKLTFFNSVDARRTLYGENAGTPGAQTDSNQALDLSLQDRDHDLSGACGGPKSLPTLNVLPGILLTILDWSIGQIVTLIFNEVDKSLQDYINTYVRSYTAHTSSRIDLYSLFSPNYPLGPKPAIVCFRLTRYRAVPANRQTPPELATDFVGSITYDPADPTQLHLRPLRLYYTSFDDVLARTTLDKDGDRTALVDVSLTATNFYLQVQGIGRADIASIDLGSVAVSQAAFAAPNAHGHFYHLYDIDKDKTGTAIPLPSWDVNPKVSSPRDNHMLVNVTVKEAGNPPELAKFFANLIHSNASDEIKALSAAAQLNVECKIDPSQTKCK